MRKVKDQRGVVVDKILRNNSGGLIVDDKKGFAAYQAARERALNTNNRVKSLEEEVIVLKALVAQLLENQGKSGNG